LVLEKFRVLLSRGREKDIIENPTPLRDVECTMWGERRGEDSLFWKTGVRGTIRDGG